MKWLNLLQYSATYFTTLFIAYDGLLRYTGISKTSPVSILLMLMATMSSLWICEKLDGIDTKKGK